jgi:hypothetical protein
MARGSAVDRLRWEDREGGALLVRELSRFIRGMVALFELFIQRICGS